MYQALYRKYRPTVFDDVVGQNVVVNTLKNAIKENNNTITVHIRHLREKMGDSFEKPKYIKTVWGCGYKIEG